MSIKEEAKHKIQWTVKKYIAKDSKEIEEKGIKPYEVVKGNPHNCLLHEGIATFLGLLCSIGSEVAYSNTNARIGVGSGDANVSAWAASTAYSLGAKVKPTTANGNVYECTTAGTSGTTEPTWPTVDGATVTDGTVVWTCRTGTPADTQTGLIATSAYQLYKGMNTTYPLKSGDHNIVFQSDFVAGEAEWAWLEECIDNGATATKDLCRQNTSLGTKPAGQVWRLTGTVTWT